MKNYVDKDKLQEFATKLHNKQKTIFAPIEAVGAPLTAATVADMTDETKVYVYTGSETGYTAGNWYYYDGSDWVSGGVYNATVYETDITLTESGKPADAKVTGDIFNDISALSLINHVDETNLLNISGATYSNGFYTFTAGNARAKYNLDTFPHREFKENTQYTLTALFKQSGTSGNGLVIIFTYTDDTANSIVLPAGISEETRYSLTSIAGKTISKINFSYYSNLIVYIKDLMVVEGVTAPNEFIPYNNFTAIDNAARNKANGNETVIHDLLIEGNQQNLFSKYNALHGYLTITGAYTIDQAATNRTTDFIPISNQTKITMQAWMEIPADTTHWQAFCFYDSSKNMIGSRNVQTGSTAFYSVFSCNIPDNAVYVRASSRVYNDWKIMLQWGDIASAFEYNYDDIDYIKNYVDDSGVFSSNDTYVKSINHKGWNEAPENTLPAYIESKKHGYNYVECDVCFTSDGVPVLLHDDSINRTARNSDGTTISNTVNIADITYAEALTYDFGIYKGSKYAGTTIPTLSEFLALCKKLALKPYIELKDTSTYTNVQIVNILSIIDGYNMSNEVTIISFVTSYLELVKNNNPSIRLGRLAGSISQSTITDAQNIKTNDNEVFLDSMSYTNNEINLCKTNNIPLEIWTINSANTIRNMDGYISGITSDSLIASKVLYDSVIN